MRAHLAKAVKSKPSRSSLKRQATSPHHGKKFGEDHSNLEEVKEAAKFWRAVRGKVELANQTMLQEGGDENQTVLLNKTKLRSETEEKGGVARRPSLQLSETLKGLGDKLKTPSFLQKYIDQVPVVNPDNHWKVKVRSDKGRRTGGT